MSTMRTLVTTLFVALALAVPAMAQRWVSVPLPAPYDGGYYLDIFFLPTDPDYGWACDQTKGYVVRTTDGGSTWRGVSIADDCHLEYVQFLDRDTGYCSGPCGIYRSVDGGATWSADLTPMIDTVKANVWGGWFRTTTHGWAMGGNCGRTTFMRTTNGGQTWAVQTDTTVKESKGADPLWLPEFPDGTVYGIASGMLWRSQDSGTTWSKVATTGAGKPWHEELAMYGGSIFVPCAVDGCAPNDNVRGVRFSLDTGRTWSTFRTPADMFGTSLLDARTAWAAGYNRNVWYTSDAGRSWESRSCGIDSGDLDDILVRSETDAWVVGSGIYRLGPPTATMSDDSVLFRNACPAVETFDTVYVRNISFHKAGLRASINSGQDSDLFRIASFLDDSINVCGRYAIVIGYRPDRPGEHVATLTVELTRTDTTFTVPLVGSRRQHGVDPSDTLVTIDGRVGTVETRTITVMPTAPGSSERLVAIQRISGDTTIGITVPTLPLDIGPTTGILTVRSNIQDTGWTSARFRLVFAPCMRDTVIEVRRYGRTPIIQTVRSLVVDLECAVADTVDVPVANTGNSPLLVERILLDGAGAAAWAVLGWRGGLPLRDAILAPGQTDTLVVQYRPRSGDDVATLTIVHDDHSTKYGSTNPWTINLFGRSNRPVLSHTATVDFGRLCLGGQATRSLSITNAGQMPATCVAERLAKDIQGLATNVAVPAMSTRTFQLTWRPTTVGRYNDTIILRTTPCDSVITVVVTGMVDDLAVEYTTPAISRQTTIGQGIIDQATFRVRSTGTARITALRLDPPRQDVTLRGVAVPSDVGNGDERTVDIRWAASLPEPYQGHLVVEVEAGCVAVDSLPITLGITTEGLDLSASTLSFTNRCEAAERIDSVVIRNTGAAPRRVGPLRIEPPTEDFTILLPEDPLAVTDLAADSAASIRIRYRPSQPGTITAALRLVVDDGTETLSMPLRGVFVASRLSVGDSLVPLGTIDRCEAVRTVRFAVGNAGNLSTSIGVTVVDAVAGVAITSDVPLPVPAEGSAFVDIQVIPAALAAGPQRAVLALSDNTCDWRDTVVLTFDVVGGVLAVSPTALSVTLPSVGGSADRLIDIVNPNDVPRTLRSLAIDGGGGRWTVVDDPSPMVMQPGQSVRVAVRFTPTDVAVVQAFCVVVDEGTCTVEHRVALRGDVRTSTPGTYPVLIRTDDYTAQPEQMLDIPVFWDRDVLAADISSVRIGIGYGRLLFDLDTVLPGSWPGMRYAIDRREGEVVVDIRPENGEPMGAAGIAMVLRGRAHMALPDECPLPLTEVLIQTDSATTLDYRAGSLVVDACGPRYLIAVTNPAAIAVAAPNPSVGSISVRIGLKAADVCTVELSTLDGRTVLQRQYGLAAGDHVLEVAPDASGLYLLRIRTVGGSVYTEVRTVIR